VIRSRYQACWCIALLAAACAQAQGYPNKPVRVVTAAAGGSNDLAARVIAQELAARLDQPVIVDNRGGRFIAGEIVASATPDGHTLLFNGTTLWLGPLLQQARAPYDALADFAPIVLATRSPNVLVVNPSVPARSAQELIALAKAKPGSMNYSSGSLGASAHLAGELFKAMAGVSIACIPYKGAGPSLNALMAGEVQLSFPAAGSGMPHVRAGRLRVLAVTSARPSELAPGVPTLAASGLPGFESTSIVGMLAPRKLPAAILARLNREINAVLGKAEVRDKLFKAGMEAAGGEPGLFAETIQAEIDKYGKLIKTVGIRID
jgi:tripartite-type tricarboxylate transporter receptor subunit TctC